MTFIEGVFYVQNPLDCSGVRVSLRSFLHSRREFVFSFFPHRLTLLVSVFLFLATALCGIS